MGIELPAELRDVAAKAGARWPEADEDRMRQSAAAWREAAASLDSLAGDADGTAQDALRAVQGEAAQAARREWNGLVGEDGPLPSTARQCRAAADRLEHAADQVGATKVRIVRELVALAKNTDAAEQAAAAGHPQALASVDSAVRGTAANVARLHHSLAADVGVDGAAAGQSGRHGLLGGATGLASGALGGATGVAGGSTADVQRAGADAVSGGLDAVRETGGDIARAAPEPASAPANPDAPTWRADTEHTGPVRIDEPAAGRQVADAGTGPIPAVRADGTPASRPGWAAPGEDPASTTAPHSVHAAWAAPPAAPSGAAPAPPPPGAAPPAQPGFAPPPAAGGHVGPPPGGQPSAPPQGSAARPPTGAPPGAFGGATRRAPQGPQHPVRQPSQQAFPLSQRSMRRSPLRPLAEPTTPPGGSPQPQGERRPLRQGGRGSDAVAFVLHQFPIGYLPVAASEASRQLPARGDEPDSCRNFPPQDHPRADLVDDTDALERVRSAAVYARGPEPDEPQPLPDELTAHHDPLGELSELEWERTYATGDGEGYVWPPAEEFPEGGVEAGEPVVLQPDTVLDCLGDGSGRLAFSAATPFSRRSQPPEYAERAYRRYRVMRPLPVWQAATAPWFGQPGGGVRYRTTYPLLDLVSLGYVVELTRTRENAEARTLRIPREDVAEAEQEDAQ
ncbi:glycohydrolase toxin TNT-related protein [Saccharopolyspora rosea]|uniref:glycohydrolase toxin TNT-related protein n=2 Tax=Saccharopolyspora rosea TaxID=524884 RepID=UPI0021D9E470|nr:glycohydrolase toxin TNT-related protein [Saccharopolyspora rosea]